MTSYFGDKEEQRMSLMVITTTTDQTALCTRWGVRPSCLSH